MVPFPVSAMSMITRDDGDLLTRRSLRPKPMAAYTDRKHFLVGLEEGRLQ